MVTGGVAVRVVDPRQVVNVDHQNGNGPARCAAARGQPRGVCVEVAPVKGARQRIDQRLLEDVLVVPFPP
jgi:hypothetical protein